MRGLKSLIAVLLLFLACSNAWAITDEEIFRDFRFNFINPGARALSLGGAFIAAADDTTAIEANPAALHYVSQFEIFAEYRNVQSLTRVSTPSQAFGDVSPGSMEDFFDFRTLFNSDENSLPSFVSFAAPFRIGKSRRRARIAFSRNVVLDEQNVISNVDPLAFRTDTGLCSAPGGACTTLDYSLVSYPLVVNNGMPPTVQRYTINNQVAGLLDAELIHYNVGFSISVVRDFSLGVTATLADLSVRSDVTSVTNDPRGLINSVHPRVDVGGAISDIRRATSIDDSDSAFTYTVGLHWHPDSIFPNDISPLRFGVVYRKGAELGLTQNTFEYNAAAAIPGFEPDTSFENIFKVPDRWGVGAMYEGQHWKYSLDLERILYSDQLEGFRAGENFFTQAGRIPDLNLDPADLVFTVDDATVVHAGIEYFFTSGGGNWAQGVRAGYYNDPDNRIRLDRIDSTDPVVQSREAFFLDLFRGGEDLDHYTVGFSIGKQFLKSGTNLQFQFAGDFSDANDVFVGSAIYRFGSRR